MRRITIVLVLLVPIVALVLNAFQTTPLPAIDTIDIIKKDQPSPAVIKKMTENIQKRFSRQNVFEIVIGKEQELTDEWKVKVQKIYEEDATISAELNFSKKGAFDEGKVHVISKGDEFILGDESYSILDVSLNGTVTLNLLQKTQ